MARIKPLRLITGHMPHPYLAQPGDTVRARPVTVLECGHWLYELGAGGVGDTVGHRRRCYKCSEGWPPDAKEAQA